MIISLTSSWQNHRLPVWKLIIQIIFLSTPYYYIVVYQRVSRYIKEAVLKLNQGTPGDLKRVARLIGDLKYSEIYYECVDVSDLFRIWNVAIKKWSFNVKFRAQFPVKDLRRIPHLMQWRQIAALMLIFSWIIRRSLLWLVKVVWG